MARRNLTDRGVKALKPAGAGKRYDIADSVVGGLAVRVTDTGRRTFVLVARFPGSANPTRRAIGEYGAITLEQARSTAREWLEMIRRGVDPAIEAERKAAQEIQRQGVTFGSVAEDFIKEKLASEKRGRKVELDVRRIFIAKWGRRPISDITALDVRAVIKEMRDTPFQAHNCFSLVRRLFSWAIEQHVYGLEISPCDRLRSRAMAGERPMRDRILTDRELRAAWKAAAGLGYPYGPLIQLLILTGQRRSEVGAAQWSEFDLDQRSWSIAASRMKAGVAHVVPLTDDAFQVLDALPRFQSGDFLFSTSSGKKCVNDFSEAKLRLDAAMTAELGTAPSPWVMHDLRRTMRTHLSALPIPDLVRELIIGHGKPGLHRVYDQHAYTAEKRHGLELWAARLRGIVSPQPANVVSLAKARG